jgi:hypothetical protein
MTFQEQLKALIPPEKASEAESIFSAMTRTFERYDTDITELKQRVRSSEGVKPEDLAKAEARIAELSAQFASTESEYKKTKKLAEEYGTKLAETTQRLTETSIEKEVRKAMSAFRIVPEAVDPVFDLIRHTVKQKEDGSFIVPHKDAAGKDLESPVGDYMEKIWANTPFAKRVIVADYSTGGGAGGPGSPAAGSKKWGEMSLGEQSVLFKQNPEVARQLMASAK